MTGAEAILIIVGVVFMIGSFMVTEKLSTKELDEIAKLSEKEIKNIIDKELAEAGERINEQIDTAIEQSNDKVERTLDKETNEKIMAIGEYSDTVIENMNKAHSEVMFLYSMLNDRHTELTELSGEVSDVMTELQQTVAKAEQEKKELMDLPEQIKIQIEEEQADAKEETENVEAKEEAGNNNDRILDLFKQGKSYVDIAKELKLGLGEVKLVIELFKGEK